MAGRGRKKLKKSSAATRDATRRVPSGPAKQDEQCHLPSELLEMIFSRLELIDNIHASTVCKTWLFPAISTRKPNIAPWLMSYPKKGSLFEFYDPSQRRNYYLDLPELQGTRLCYAKDDWLLLFKSRTSRLFFFHPYTREVIKMPKLQLSDHIAAFSAPPTNPDCTLCTVRHIINAVLAITTCKIGDNQWTTTAYQTDPPFTSSIWNKLVFCNGRFYFMTLIGWLGIFDPIDKTLTISVPPPRCIELVHLEPRWRHKFMAEHNGDIYLIYTCAAWEPFVYKLNLERREWDEDRSLKGTTIFATFVSSCVRSDLVGDMAGKVYFPTVMFWGKRCVTYCPKIDRYAPRNELRDWGEVDLFRSVWIEAPKDVSMFLKGSGYKGKGKSTILNA